MNRPAETNPEPMTAHPIARAGDWRLRWISFLASGLTIGVLAQAVLAGQILTGRHWLVTTHRVMAEAFSLMTSGLVVLAWQDWRAHLSRRWIFVAALAASVLLVAQTGLGFIGRRSSSAIGLHIPLGVLLLGVYVGLVLGVENIRAVERR